MPLATTPQLLTDDEQARFAALIYERTGIRIPPQKKTLMSNRIRRLLRNRDAETFESYYRHLRGLPSSHADWDAFLQEITTHETYLFRDMNQWDWFRDTYLAELRSRQRRDGGPATLRIWSAACSTGDEPYTIACCVADRLGATGQWQVEIVGTDIGSDALRQAREAILDERAMQYVPDHYRRRFFTASDGGRWQAKPILTDRVRFRSHNLLEPMRGLPFDLIFLKNVLIYFDADSKRRVFAQIDQALKGQGLLVSGPAEGIGDLVGGYDRLQPWLHRKP